MNRRNLEGAAGALAFVLVGVLLLAALGVTMGDVRFDDSHTYKARVANSSGLHAGDEVRAAGVSVGRVEGIDLRDDSTVVIAFSAAASIPLTTETVATIRYKNLTGDMFLDLTNTNPDAPPLGENEELPVSQTRAALDLDQLFNGFKPLLHGLSADGVNQLTSSIIAVFEGQAGSINSLLANVATFTGTLADQDQVIGEVVTNLDSVLGSLDERSDELSALVVNLKKVLQGLAADRGALGGSLENLSRLARSGSGFLQALRPELRGTVEQTQRVAAALNSDLGAVDRALSALPEALRLAGRIGAYGSFYNLYLCGISVSFSGPNGIPAQGPMFYDKAERCAFKDGEEQ